MGGMVPGIQRGALPVRSIGYTPPAYGGGGGYGGGYGGGGVGSLLDSLGSGGGSSTGLQPNGNVVGGAPQINATPSMPARTTATAPATGTAPTGFGTPSTTAPGAPPATNFAAPDQNLNDLVGAYKKRLTQLQTPTTLDQGYTDKAINSARGAIADSAAGAQEGASARLAAQGRLGGGGETAARSRIAEAAQRAGNKAASDISLARVRDEEQNALSRDQMQNSFLLGGSGIAAAPANLALAQQGLNLQQELGLGNLNLGQENAQLNRDQFASGRDDARLSNLLGILRMFPQAGYAGY